jgi:Gpi18-like mannosyltransferase
MDESIKKSRIELLLLFALYLFILPRVYMDYDMGFWREWALTIHHNGLANTYNSTINYYPVFIYALYIFDLLQGTDAHIIHNINDIKILFVCFDFLPLVVLCCFRQKILKFKIPYLFLLLNIAYIFDSMVWGQIDSIYTSLSFLAIVIALLYPVPGMLLYLLALNTKPQAIEFLPVMAVALYYSILKFRTFLVGMVAVIALQLLLLLPFFSTGGVEKLFTITTHIVGLYPKLSVCAFNIWYLIVRGNPWFINDTDTFFLVSYKVFGLVMFSFSALALLVPLFNRIRFLRKNKAPLDNFSYELLFLATGMLCLCFFYFNSQMHERYAQPIIIFFFFYGVVSRNYKLYILASIPYFLSLDKCFPDYLPIVHYKFIYASVVIALWYTITLVYGGYLFYLLQKKVSVLPVLSDGGI